MSEKPYTILKQGIEEDGSTWADYIDDVGQEIHIEVRAGLDLEERIALHVRENREYREEIAAMSPEELARIDRIAQTAGRQWGDEF